MNTSNAKRVYVVFKGACIVGIYTCIKMLKRDILTKKLMGEFEYVDRNGKPLTEVTAHISEATNTLNIFRKGIDTTPYLKIVRARRNILNTKEVLK